MQKRRFSFFQIQSHFLCTISKKLHPILKGFFLQNIYNALWSLHPKKLLNPFPEGQSKAKA